MRRLSIIIIIITGLMSASPAMAFEPLKHTLAQTSTLPITNTYSFTNPYDFTPFNYKTGDIGASGVGIDLTPITSKIGSLWMLNGIVKGALTIWAMVWDNPFFMEYFLLIIVLMGFFWFADWIYNKQHNRPFGLGSTVQSETTKLRRYLEDRADNPYRDKDHYKNKE